MHNICSLILSLNFAPIAKKYALKSPSKIPEKIGTAMLDLPKYNNTSCPVANPAPMTVPINTAAHFNPSFIK